MLVFGLKIVPWRDKNVTHKNRYSVICFSIENKRDNSKEVREIGYKYDNLRHKILKIVLKLNLQYYRLEKFTLNRQTKYILSY